MSLQVDGITIAGRLYLPTGGGPHHAVCICHGIPSGHPPDPGDGGYPALAEEICGHGFATMIFNFRGTGDSGGNLDMPGWTDDLKAVIDYLAGRPDVSGISLLGFSAGAAVSICVAAGDRRVSAVAACASPAEFDFSDMVDSPEALVQHFRSIGAIRDEDFPASVRDWYASFNRVDPIDYVAGIAPRPLLLVHGTEDETVNISHARRLYEQAGEPRQLVIVEGAGHRLRQDRRAMSAVIDWLMSRRN